MIRTIAGIDIHKKVLMAVVATVVEREVEGGLEQQIEYEGRRFGSGRREREHLAAWLQERRAEEVVMESTAQYRWLPSLEAFVRDSGIGGYHRSKHSPGTVVSTEYPPKYWKPVWMDLEPHFPRLHLAQAYSNKAPKGRKNDFADARRLKRRMAAGELILAPAPCAAGRRRFVARGKPKRPLRRKKRRAQKLTQALRKLGYPHLLQQRFGLILQLMPKLGYKGAIWALTRHDHAQVGYDPLPAHRRRECAYVPGRRIGGAGVHRRYF